MDVIFILALAVSTPAPAPSAKSATTMRSTSNMTSTMKKEEALSQDNKKRQVIAIHCCICVIIGFLFLALEIIVQRKTNLRRPDNDNTGGADPYNVDQFEDPTAN